MKKTTLILISTVILFNLINIGLAQAGIFVERVLYNDYCPAEGATVYVRNSTTEITIGICTPANATGHCQTIMNLKPNTWYKSNTSINSVMCLWQTNDNGDGGCPNPVKSKTLYYPNGTLTCEDTECDGLKYCYNQSSGDKWTDMYLECRHSDQTPIWNYDCDTKKCCSCNGGTLANPQENYNSTKNSGCVDSNECTQDNCITIDQCENPYEPQGAQCGLARDCPDNQCNGFFANFYPADGHDTCDGSGSCIDYSCALENSYCTDNNPFDGVNSLECDASCDQDIDCSENCVNKKWYSTYSCNSGTCGCDLSNPVCVKNVCGAECDGPEDCLSGLCQNDCTCFVDSVPPIITILSPQNATYYSNSTPLTFTINESTIWIKYSIDGQSNNTTTGNTILTGLSNSSHSIIVYAKDTSGNEGSSNRIYFTNRLGVYNPWETSFINSEPYPVVDIEEFNGELYFAANNKLYTFNGTRWNVIQVPTDLSYPLSIKTYSNKLYVTGSGGKIYSYNGSTFVENFSTNNQYAKMLGTYNGKLYAGTYLAKPAKLYFSSDGVNWQWDVGFNNTLSCSGPFCSIDSFANDTNNKLYITSGGTIYRYDGSWSAFKTYDDVYSFNDMKVFNDKLYLVTRDANTRCPMYAGGSGFCGRVIEYDGTGWSTKFDNIGPNGYWMYSLEVYHDKLYAGTANKIYKWNGTWQVNFNSVERAEYVLVLKNWASLGRIYAGFGNGVMFKDDLLEPKPDLTIDDIWNSGTTIYYKIKNQVNANSNYTYSKLYVDGVYRATDFVNSLTTSSSSNEYFTYTWTCSTPTDTIKVCADELGYVTESNETNNCLTKTFNCPTTCTCTPWILDDTGCCKIRTCTPRGCAIERSCSKYCIL